mgnify:FL=1
MKIGIITAMSSEQKQLANQLENKTERKEGPFTYIEGNIKQNTIILMQCGIGKVNAAAGTVELIRNFQPDCIISTGVAGGIDTCLKVMDVVVSQQIVYHDVWCGEGNAYGQIQGLPTFFQGNETLFQCALSLDTETAIHGGLICTGDKFITDRSELDEIKHNFPEGLAVDMESASIARYATSIRSLSSVSASSVTLRELTSTLNNTRISGGKWPTVLSTLLKLS